jgi:hypothetical protein
VKELINPMEITDVCVNNLISLKITGLSNAGCNSYYKSFSKGNNNLMGTLIKPTKS